MLTGRCEITHKQQKEEKKNCLSIVNYAINYRIRNKKPKIDINTELGFICSHSGATTILCIEIAWKRGRVEAMIPHGPFITCNYPGLILPPI